MSEFVSEEASEHRWTCDFLVPCKTQIYKLFKSLCFSSACFIARLFDLLIAVKICYLLDNVRVLHTCN